MHVGAKREEARRQYKTSKRVSGCNWTTRNLTGAEVDRA